MDRAKIELIEKIPPPNNIRGSRSFLDHARFYRRFIKDVFKITKPLCDLLNKDATFDFNDKCLNAFNSLKKALTSTLFITSPDWLLPFEFMCDANDYTVGAVLGQRKKRKIAFYLLY